MSTFLSPPLPQPSDVVAIMLQERAIAEKIDRQLTHRSAARSVTALGAMLAHEIKNPLSGIRGAAQLLEANVSDEDRGLTRLICDETDRIVKLVDRMQAFAATRPGQWREHQHPFGAGPCEAARAGRFRPRNPFRRGLRSVAAACAGIARPAHPGLPQSGEERGGGDRRRMGATAKSRSPPPTGPGCACARTPSDDPVALPLEICIRDNGSGHSLRTFWPTSSIPSSRRSRRGLV